MCPKQLFKKTRQQNPHKRVAKRIKQQKVPPLSVVRVRFLTNDSDTMCISQGFCAFPRPHVQLLEPFLPGAVQAPLPSFRVRVWAVSPTFQNLGCVTHLLGFRVLDVLLTFWGLGLERCYSPFRVLGLACVCLTFRV